MIRMTRILRQVLLLGASALLAVPTVSSQEPSATASFPARAVAITVDVVVLDEHDHPVRGLTTADFTVLEDGREQTISNFEAHALGEVRPETAAASFEGRPSPSPTAATNEGPSARPARVFALLIDDLGISAPVMLQLKTALARWISEQSDPRDEITITTTSGDVWWSDIVARGREDFLTVLNRVQGKLLSPAGKNAMSDWEAYQISAEELGTGGPAGSRASDVLGTVEGGAVAFVGGSVLERVMQRWLASRECPPCAEPGDDLDLAQRRANMSPADCPAVQQCRRRVQSRAQELHALWMHRGQTVYAAVAGLSRSLAGAPGRKSILLISESLLNDTDLGVPLRNAVDASQRGNSALYFMGAQGLAGSSIYQAEQSAFGRSQDVGSMKAAEELLATAGGVGLAEATGGAAVASSNDFAAGLARMASDSSAYYLLGYQPQEAPDGRWHGLQVKVARPHSKVLARKGYRATRLKDQTPSAEVERGADGEKRPGAKASKRPLAPELLTGSAREGIPLRIAAYLQDTNGAGLARVQVVIEIDNSRVWVERAATPWRASLDLTIMAASPFRRPAVPIDERLSLSLGPAEVATGWWLVPRTLWLPPGLTQLRAYVRDRASGTVGLVTERLVVPDVDQPYLSTPVLTDRTLPPRKSGDPPRLVPVAHRQFGKERPLFCQFELFTFGGQDLPGAAQLQASYAIEKPDGQPVSQGPATPIKTDGHYAARRIVLPIEALDDGPYVLLLTVEDRLAQRTLVTRAPFVVRTGAERIPADE